MFWNHIKLGTSEFYVHRRILFGEGALDTFPYKNVRRLFHAIVIFALLSH